MEEALDIQHDTDPGKDHGLARRIPHLGHTILFFSILAFCVMLCIAVALAVVHATSPGTVVQHPLTVALGQILGYVLAIGVAVLVFPMLWTVSFWQGIHWTWRQARLQWWKFLALGVAMSALAQGADQLFKTPNDPDILKLFSTPLAAWLTVTLGTFIPTFVEEVAFRGFLLPSLATAYDWLSLERSPAGLDRWQRTTIHSTGSWVFATTFSSLAFTALHGFQIHWAIGPLAVLFVVSVVLSIVRIRTRSVAASTLVHMAYDGLIFLEMIIATHGFRHLDKLLQM